jgi:hypothetical protein
LNNSAAALTATSCHLPGKKGECVQLNLWEEVIFLFFGKKFARRVLEIIYDNLFNLI